MIKCVLFDLDGVLVNTKDIHFECLNNAIKFVTGVKEYEISIDDHLKRFDGLSTREKLNILSKEKGLPRSTHDIIWAIKQEKTEKALENIKLDSQIIECFTYLKQNGYLIGVCSNAIRNTVTKVLRNSKVNVDLILSNEDVRNPKPHPEIYLRALVSLGLAPEEAVILEDSYFGRLAGKRSGIKTFGINNPSEVTVDLLKLILSDNTRKPIELSGGNMKVIIPMAGHGSRFAQAGYTFPKPLIDINGKPMIQRVVENIGLDCHHIFIVQKEHCEKYNLPCLLRLIRPNSTVIPIDSVTQGAACTTLFAEQYMDGSGLIIANSDQFVDDDIPKQIYKMVSNNVDGGILTFTSTHPKWSFVREEDGYVVEVAEKKPISNKATVGIYYWKHGSDYRKYAHQMIDKDIRVNGEFYVCPVFNEAIADGKKVKAYDIEKMWGLGTPEDLAFFLREKV